MKIRSEGDVYMTAIIKMLRTFGITRCYKGFDIAVYSIQLVLVDDFRLQAVIKEVYMETAIHFHCNWTGVERNLRTAVKRAWQVNPELLRKMAGYPLMTAPTSSEFLEIVSSYIARNANKDQGEYRTVANKTQTRRINSSTHS